MVTTTDLAARSTDAAAGPNLAAFVEGLAAGAEGAGLTRPHRLAAFLAQWAHESMGFEFDAEIWGPTPAQRRYEGRRDVGNTEPGDGRRFRGRTAAQLTGRDNYRRFTGWAAERGAPDFEVDPDALLTNPWEGLVPIWYWSTGNPTGTSLIRFADDGDHEMITRRINGGLNGFDGRLARYARAALVLGGRDGSDVRGFQRDVGLVVDGIAGPRTRAALHAALVARPPVDLRGGDTRPAVGAPEVDDARTRLSNAIRSAERALARLERA